MKERLFRFKEFAVRHELSAMKVGVDGVLLGAWADVSGNTLLDVGTGCGLLALMALQRNPGLQVLGIDIHAPSIEEAQANAADTPWDDKVRFDCRSFRRQLSMGWRFDLIISNPPFFNAGVNSPKDDRERSRHAAELSPQALIVHATNLLNPGGRLCMITPRDQLDGLLALAQTHRLVPRRLTEVTTVEGKAPKRLLSEWECNIGTHQGACAGGDTVADAPECTPTLLSIEEGKEANRRFSKEYTTLCAPFYLHF